MIAERPHLTHAMRDEEDGDALLLETADDLAEPIDVAAGKSRCRLIEQQETRLAEDGARDLDFLLHGEIEFADLGFEVDIEPQRVEMLAQRAAAVRRRIMPVRPHRSVGQEHVVEDRQVRGQRHFLERGLDAEGVRDSRRAQAHLLAEKLILPWSGSISPERSLTIVDLPAPFSPSSACTLPGAMVNETSSTATVAPNVLRRLTTDAAAPPDASVMRAPSPGGAGSPAREFSRRRRSRPALARISFQAGRPARRSSRFQASARRKSRRTIPDCGRSRA